MEISCSPALAAKFDRAFALLHNFWYARALEGFRQVSNVDPECAIAYWGAAMTYNHPFWDGLRPRTRRLHGVWCQKGLAAKKMSRAEKLYLNAVAALFKDAGAGAKAAGTKATAMPWLPAYASFPDDETKLFYGLAILGASTKARRVLSARHRQPSSSRRSMPAVRTILVCCNYLIHVYDDPVHAEEGLEAARKYTKVAAAVPHALHMPSHIFTSSRVLG